MKRLINKLEAVGSLLGKSAALLNEGFELVWTNDGNVFECENFRDIIEKQVKNNIREYERGFSFSVDGLVYLLRVSPLYENGKLLGYFCKTDSRSELCSLIDQSGMLPSKLISVLRGNINNILCISHMLADKIENKENSPEYKFLQQQIQQGENILLQYINLAELVNDNDLDNYKDSVDITDLCEKICERAQDEMSELDRRIDCCWSADACYIHASHVKTSMMILNILQNAIRFSPEKSKINLKISNDEHFVYISCSNSRATHADYEAGSFLGIPVIRKIASEIGGKCEITSADDIYTFRVTLPTVTPSSYTLNSSKADYEGNARLIRLFLNTAKLSVNEDIYSN